MYKIIILILGLVIFSDGFCQSSKKYNIEAGYVHSGNLYWEDLANLSYWGANFLGNKHKVGLGFKLKIPEFQESNKKHLTNSETLKYSMPVYVYYQYFIGGDKLRPFVRYTFDHHFYSYLYYYANSKYLNRHNVFTNSIGIGIKQKLKKRLSIVGVVSGGCTILRSKSAFETKSGVQQVEPYIHNNFSYNFRIGMGVELGNLNKY